MTVSLVHMVADNTYHVANDDLEIQRHRTFTFSPRCLETPPRYAFVNLDIYNRTSRLPTPINGYRYCQHNIDNNLIKMRLQIISTQ